MLYGIRLTGTERDLAALHTLAESFAALVVAPWTTLSWDDAAASVITSEGLDLSVAQGLRAKGVAVVRIAREGEAASFTALKGSRKAERVSPVVVRDAPSLVEALRPVRAHGDPVCDEAAFWIPLDGDGAQRTLERLLALRRDDFSVSELVSPEESRRVLLVRVSAPPMYLLLRAREEPDEGVTAFARAGDGLWVEWSWSQPLAHVVSRILREADRTAFVRRDGGWRFAPAKLPARSVYDVVQPRFDAPRVMLTAAPGESRFTIRLRLAPGPVGDPELWILDPEQFLALEPLIEALTPEELSRFTVARTTGSEGTRYVLQEIVRPGVSRLGVRVSDLARAPGFVRVAGTDNLYLPPARQLTPRMRRDELRELLQLDQARAVVVGEDRDGPRVLRVMTAEEVPLSRWVDYVATDRRMELDRLEEDSVFDWPELTVAAPPRERAKDERRADATPRPQPPRVRRIEVPRPEAEEQNGAPVVTEDAAIAAVREEIRGVERTLAAGGVDDPAPWARLAVLKARVQEVDDAAGCLETVMFFEAPTASRARDLVALRERAVGAPWSDDALARALERKELTPPEAAYLGARMLERAVLGQDVDPGAEKRLTEPDTALSRRLAWSLALCLHRRTGDRLGLTRARERVLGGMNDRGLSELADMPRFVRFALALEAGDRVGVERTRAEQMQVLESLWALVARGAVRGLDSLDAYLRLVFAVGYARLGEAGRGRELVESVDAAESSHEAPNKLLFKLYRARFAHAATQADPNVWRQEVDTLLASVKEPRVKDRVEWLRKRSEWLRTAALDSVGATTRPAMERSLADAEGNPSLALTTLTSLMDDRALFDFEVRIVGQRMLRVGLRSGNDDLLADLLRAASNRLTRVKHPGHCAELVGACLQAAAVLGDGEAVERLLDAVVNLANAPEAPATRDLLNAVTPGLAALRRLGAGASSRRFLDALVPVAPRGQREGIRLRAALADGFLQLREIERADELIDQCLDDTFGASLDHVGRYEAGVAVLAALKHWPMAKRAPRCLRVLEGLDRFTDSFTASTQRIYETHKVLVAERLVDAVVDDVTFQGDRVRAWLDEEEQATRRRILADWRDVCGR